MYKEKIESLWEKARELDPYFALVNSKKLMWEIRDEIDEVIEAWENNDNAEIEKELWDVYWVFQILAQKLEQEWKIDMEKMYERIYTKISTRKSFLEEWKKVTTDQAKEIWNKAKTAEWYSEDRMWNDERVNCD